MKKFISVVGAVILKDGLILCAQRGPNGAPAGLWEFPGGKVEPGETPRDALEREVAEELGCVVEVGDVVTTTEYEYDFGMVSLTTFHCTLISGEPTLTEHAEVRWLSPDRLAEVQWAPADVPAVHILTGVTLA